ncbi:transcriptional regulator [Bacillus pseudomycoides]|nr:transcriptional regulator [Bacillus pseudomycoides]
MANKQDLYKEVKTILTDKSWEISSKEAEILVDTVLDSIIDLTVEHEKLKLAKFGDFEIRERAARKGYNPKLLKELKEQGLSDEEAKLQAQIDIEASKTPAFKPAKAFKDTVK